MDDTMDETEALRFAANILRTLSVTAEPESKQAALKAVRILDRYNEKPPSVPEGYPPWPWERESQAKS